MGGRRRARRQEGSGPLRGRRSLRPHLRQGGLLTGIGEEGDVEELGQQLGQPLRSRPPAMRSATSTLARPKAISGSAPPSRPPAAPPPAAAPPARRGRGRGSGARARGRRWSLDQQQPAGPGFAPSRPSSAAITIPHPLERGRRRSRDRPPPPALPQLGEEVVGGGEEAFLLVVEVLVEGGPRDARPPDDVGDRRLVEALLRAAARQCTHIPLALPRERQCPRECWARTTPASGASQIVRSSCRFRESRCANRGLPLSVLSRLPTVHRRSKCPAPPVAPSPTKRAATGREGTPPSRSNCLALTPVAACPRRPVRERLHSSHGRGLG